MSLLFGGSSRLKRITSGPFIDLVNVVLVVVVITVVVVDVPKQCDGIIAKFGNGTLQ